MTSPLAHPARTRLGRLAVFVSSLLAVGAVIAPATSVAAVNVNLNDTSWSPQATMSADYNGFTGVAAVDATHAFAVGTDASSNGVVYATTDGGANWSIVWTLPNATWSAVAAGDATHVFVTGEAWDGTNNNGVIYASTDGGANWSPQFSDPEVYFASLAAVNDNVVYAAGQKAGDGAVYVTHNGGLSWDLPATGVFSWSCDSGSSGLNNVTILDTNHAFVGGYICSGEDFILRTTDDQGYTWSATDAIAGTGTGRIWGGAAIDAMHAYAVGEYQNTGAIYTTDDGGVNWTQVFTLPNSTVRSIVAINALRAYAVSDSPGEIYVTDDGGANWSPQFAITSSYSGFTDIAAFGADHVYAVGSDFDADISSIYGLNVTHTPDAPDPYNAARNANLGGVVGNVYYYAFNAGEDYSNSETDVCAWNIVTHVQVQLNPADPNGCQSFDGQILTLGSTGTAMVAVATPTYGDTGSYAVNLSDGTLGAPAADLASYTFSLQVVYAAGGDAFVQADDQTEIELSSTGALVATYDPGTWIYGVASNGSKLWMSGWGDNGISDIRVFTQGSSTLLATLTDQFASGTNNDIAGLAYANGYLWVSGNDDSDGLDQANIARIAQVDPTSGDVLQTWSNFTAPYGDNYTDYVIAATAVGGNLYLYGYYAGSVAIFNTATATPEGLLAVGAEDYVMFPAGSGVLVLPDTSADNHPVYASAASLPTASFMTAGQTAGQAITFTPTAPAGGSYLFDYGDGAAAFSLDTTYDTSPSHTYATAGTYPATMIATDVAGNEAIVTQNLTISSGTSSSGTVVQPTDPGTPPGGFAPLPIVDPIISDPIPGSPPITTNPPPKVWDNQGGPWDTAAYPVTTGDVVTASGDWYLSGHYADMVMCFGTPGAGTCAPIGTSGTTASLGAHGSATFDTGWVHFALTDTAPAGATSAYLEWSAGSDSGLAYLEWSIESGSSGNHAGTPATAATGTWVNCYEQTGGDPDGTPGQVNGCIATPDDATTTLATVDTMIELDNVPTTIDFGHGVPYAVLTPGGQTMVVTTNSLDGYALTATFAPLTRSDQFGAELVDAIPVVTIAYAMGTSPTTWTALGAVTGHADQGLATLANVAHRSNEAGDSVIFNAQLTVPFVNAGSYAGTATFAATTL